MVDIPGQKEKNLPASVLFYCYGLEKWDEPFTWQEVETLYLTKGADPLPSSLARADPLPSWQEVQTLYLTSP